MIEHSRIFDGFYNDPNFVRDMIIQEPMCEHMGSDNVTYPGIVKITHYLEQDMLGKLHQLLGKTRINLMFARHSYEDMKPPNWAHSDMNMTQYVGLLYLSPTDYPWDGTHFVKHKRTGMEIHPETDEQKDTLLDDSNKKELWDTTFTCPSKFNRMFIFDARYIHAAAYKFGTNRINSRLVLSVFFNLI